VPRFEDYSASEVEDRRAEGSLALRLFQRFQKNPLANFERLMAIRPLSMTGELEQQAGLEDIGKGPILSPAARQLFGGGGDFEISFQRKLVSPPLNFGSY
jgi:hypothetical protein